MLGYCIAFAASLAAFFAIAHVLGMFRHGGIGSLNEQSDLLAALEYQDSILKAVNSAAMYLLNADIESFSDDLFKAMEVLAVAAKADRMYIWENHMIDGALHCSQVHEWSEGADPLQGHELTTAVPYNEVMIGLEEYLSAGNSFNGIVSNMIPEHRAHLSAQGIVSILLVPIFDKGRFWGFVGFDDCHNEREFFGEEETILRSAGLLYAHAYQRNAVIVDIRDTSARLKVALSEANAASKAKGNFLSNMSHEMRTPLSAIIGMTAIGRKAEVAEQKNHALTKISEASSHLLGVINDVLDMATIEADKLELAPVEFQFERMLQSVLNVVQFRIDEKQQRLTVDIDKMIPNSPVGDEQRLAQVIKNLLSNAVKFTQNGGEIGLSAVLVCESDGVCELRMEISDNGIGIASEQHSKLFGMFEQAESGMNREFGGTGLGLVISKSIVELMDGKIWFESELGKGSCFFITIKALRGNENYGIDSINEGLGTVPDAPNNVLDNSMFNGKILLLAEDVEINREILLALLEDTGLAIESAENGSEALDMVAASPGKYDIVFMDVQMPKMDGLEATRRIRALPDCGKGVLPIIAMTANVSKSDIEECIEAGMDGHLGKPLDIDKVNEVLRQYLHT